MKLSRNSCMRTKPRLPMIGIAAFINICFATIAGCTMTSSISDFRFENHRDDESLSGALLKLHPPGTPIEAARQTLERAGARCKAVVWSRQGKLTQGGGYSCQYSYVSGSVDVQLRVFVDGNRAGEVINFSSFSQLTGP